MYVANSILLKAKATSIEFLVLMTGVYLKRFPMFSLPLSILLVSTLSSGCQAAQVPFSKEPFSVESLKTIVLEKYPRTILYNISKPDTSDLDFASTLGSYLFHHESRLLLTKESDVFIDAAKLEKVLFEELIDVQVDIRIPLSSLQEKMGVFVKRILNTALLKTEFSLLEMDENGLCLLRLASLHDLIAECALNQLAPVSIDIAILKWVLLSARNEVIKPFIFKIVHPIVDTVLGNSLISLMFHPGVCLHVQSELNEFMGLMKGLSKDIFDFYGSCIASLLLPLPECNHRLTLTDFISECKVMTMVNDDPNVHLSDMLITSSSVHVNSLKSLRKKYKMRTLLGASLEFFEAGAGYLNVSNFSCFYVGSLINGQFQEEGLQLVGELKLKNILIQTDRTGDGCDVFVCSLIPLTTDVLQIISMYALGVPLGRREQEVLFYAQAAFGITMISAPKIAY